MKRVQYAVTETNYGWLEFYVEDDTTTEQIAALAEEMYDNGQTHWNKESKELTKEGEWSVTAQDSGLYQ